MVRKNAPDEKVGVMCLEDGRPSIVEYYELTDELMNAKDEKGEPAYNYGVILNYLFKVQDLEKIMEEKMPLHIVEKKIPYLDENGEPYTCSWVSIVKTDNNGTIAVSRSQATAEKYLRGSVNTEVKVITNAPAYELPETGGIGTSLYTIGGLLLIAVSLLYGYKLRRKRERRYEP